MQPSTSALVRPETLLLPDGSPASSAWPLEPEVLHLNHGSYGAVPWAALRRQQYLRAQMEANPVGWMTTQAAQVGETRDHLARYLAVSPENLALVPNASGGASVVFNAQILPPGSDVLVTNHGYGAVTMGAARLARRYGATLTVAQIPLDATADEATEAVLATASERTRLLVIDQITSPTALLLPVADIISAAHARGIRVLVDGAHSPGLIDRPLAGLDCDYWVGNFHKFGCAPRGCAALVAAPVLAQELFPLIDSWATESPFPGRFDMQGTLDHTNYLAAPAAWDFLDDTWGWDRIRTHIAQVVDWGANLIAEAFAEATGENHHVNLPLAFPLMQLVRLPAPLADSEEACGELRDRLFSELGAEAAITRFAGSSYLRLTAHAYSTAEDFEAFRDRCVPTLLRWAGVSS